MTVGRDGTPRSSAPPYRGHHGSGMRQRRTGPERARIVLVLASVAALFAVLAVALLPFARARYGLSSSPEPVPAGVSAPRPTQAPVPGRSTAPSPTIEPPDPPPGFPSAIPTAPVGPTPSAAPPVASPTGAPPSVPVPVSTVTFEAESVANTLGGGTHVRTATAASGGEVVGSLGGDPASTLRFNQVVVPVDGAYTMTVFYLSAVDRSATISVDGEQAVSIPFPSTGDRETVGSVAFRVTLIAGVNTVELGNPAESAPDIDRITVAS
jgi:hypothetical protein